MNVPAIAKDENILIAMRWTDLVHEFNVNPSLSASQGQKVHSALAVESPSLMKATDLCQNPVKLNPDRHNQRGVWIPVSTRSRVR